MAQVVLFIPDAVHQTVSELCARHSVTKPSAYVALLTALVARPDICESIIKQHGTKALPRTEAAVQVKLRHRTPLDVAREKVFAFLDGLPDGTGPLSYTLPRRREGDTLYRSPLKLTQRQAAKLAAAAERAGVTPHELLTLATRDDEVARQFLDKARGTP